MGQRTKGTKGRYLVHAGRDFRKRVPGWGPFNDKSYKKGQIIDNQSTIRAMKTDMRQKAVHKVKPRYGHLGDIVRVKKRRRDGVVQTYRIRREVERYLPEAERLDVLESRKSSPADLDEVYAGGEYLGKDSLAWAEPGEFQAIEKWKYKRHIYRIGRNYSSGESILLSFK